MTLHWTDLILVLAFVVAGCVTSYLLLLRQIRQIVTKHQLNIADQLGALDDAIRALETRLAEHHAPSAAPEKKEAATIQAGEFEDTPDARESEAIAPEIQAVIAAATVAALGQDAHVRSVKPAASPWSQQGRVLVQGSHNARAGR